MSRTCSISVELIEQVRDIPGVRGVHIQAIEWEKRVPEILEKAGVLPRPDLPEEQPDNGAES